MPAVMSTWLFRQFKHMLAGFDWIRVPQRQQRMVGREEVKAELVLGTEGVMSEMSSMDESEYGTCCMLVREVRESNAGDPMCQMNNVIACCGGATTLAE